MPLLIADTAEHSGWKHWGEGDAIRCWLGVPLISGEGQIGVLSLAGTMPRAYSQPQVDLLLTFADQAAIAVVNAQLYDRAQALAVAGERDRIARDLHDAVTQTIFSASLIAGTLPARLSSLSEEAQSDVEALQTLTRGALAEMRTLLLELRPEHLAEVNLDLLLTQLAQAFTGRTGVPADVDANPDPQYAPPTAVKTAFYRVAQEAFNNIAKHAQASRVSVRYSTRPRSIHLAVLDDGRGFNTQGVAPERLGLAIMRERAQVIGAQLTIDSEPDLGTHLFMVWNDEDNT
jgi:two-component system nitrate/nitrite sensor histidine kinase NarX